MKTLTTCVLISLSLVIPTLADMEAATNKTAPQVVSHAITAPVPATKQTTNKVEMGMQPTQAVATSQPPAVERIPLEIRKSFQRNLLRTGRFYWKNGVEIGLNLQPEFAPYPRDSGIGAQFEIRFRLEKEWKRKRGE